MAHSVSSIPYQTERVTQVVIITRDWFWTYFKRVSVLGYLTFLPVVLEGVQENEVQIVVNGLCVLESVCLEIGKNTIKTLRILDNLKQ